MAQLKNYPLPPLFLTEIIEDYQDLRGLQDVQVIKIEEGHGKHVHDDPDDPNGCQWVERYDNATNRYIRVPRPPGWTPCMLDCDDSDWIVHLDYSGAEAHEKISKTLFHPAERPHAVYGVKRHGDVQRASLWCD